MLEIEKCMHPVICIIIYIVKLHPDSRPYQKYGYFCNNLLQVDNRILGRRSGKNSFVKIREAGALKCPDVMRLNAREE